MQKPKPPRLPDTLTAIPEGYKACEGPCGEMLLVDHFHKDTNASDGLKTWCKKCRTEKNQKRRGKRAIRAAQKMDAALLRALDELSKGERSTGIHVSDIAEQTFAILGNSYGFAQHIASHLLMTKPGSVQRQRMLEMLMRLAMKNTELGGATVELENMTAEELEALYSKRIEERAREMLTIYTEAADVKRIG